MKITLHGTRGSLAAAGPETVLYGGDTSSVEVQVAADSRIVLDAGSGVRRLGELLPRGLKRIDVLLTHLHMDHIQGLGFFAPIYDPAVEVHIWGPASITMDLEQRLSRYLSPPLFPVLLRDLPEVHVHDLYRSCFELGDVTVTSDVVTHPGPTLGYRLDVAGSSLAYVPDHELALGTRSFPDEPEWTSGYAIVEGADLLIHDAQYFEHEYASHQGWGHSTYEHVIAFAEMAAVRRLVSFHHDPSHSDAQLEEKALEMKNRELSVEFIPGKTGTVIEIGSP